MLQIFTSEELDVDNIGYSYKLIFRQSANRQIISALIPDGNRNGMMSLFSHDLPAWTNHRVQMSKVSEGQRSGELWRLSWQVWLFMGSVPWGGGGGEGRIEKRWNTVREGEGARGADVPYLLSFLVRALVWTVMCMSVDITSGLLWHASLGLAWSWRLTLRCEVRGRDGAEGASWWGCHGLNKETLWAPRFLCLLSHQWLQTVFLVLCWLHVRVL